MIGHRKPKETVESFDPTMSVGLGDLIALFNVSTRTIQIMIDGGYILKNKQQLYNLNVAVQGFARYKSDHGIKRSGTTKEAASTRVQDARARQIEQETALQAKELISFSEHCAIVDLLIGGISVEMDGLSARLTRDRETRRQYDQVIVEMKQRLSDKWARMAASSEEEAAGDDEEDT